MSAEKLSLVLCPNKIFVNQKVLEVRLNINSNKLLCHLLQSFCSRLWNRVHEMVPSLKLFFKACSSMSDFPAYTVTTGLMNNAESTQRHIVTRKISVVRASCSAEKQRITINRSVYVSLPPALEDATHWSILFTRGEIAYHRISSRTTAVPLWTPRDQLSSIKP